MTEIKVFTTFSDKILNEEFAGDKTQLAVYNLERDFLIKSLFTHESIPEIALEPTMKSGIGIGETLECINIVVTLFHLYTHFKKQKKLDKLKDLEETVKDTELTRVLNQNGIDSKDAAKIASKYKKDFIDMLDNAEL